MGRKQVNLVLITHFHLDHCGALPFFTELQGEGYDGPIVMSMPTKALLPYMLEDYRRVCIIIYTIDLDNAKRRIIIGL